MSDIINCITYGCTPGKFVLALLDLLVPVLLDIVIIGLLFDKFMDWREKSQWKHATWVLYARLIKLQDNLLQVLVPDSQRDTTVKTIRSGDTEVDTLFEWHEPNPNFELIEQELVGYLDAYEDLIRDRVSLERNNLNLVIQAHGNHIDGQLFGLILDLDTSMTRFQSIASLDKRSGNQHLSEVAFSLIKDTANLRDWILQRKEIEVVD